MPAGAPKGNKNAEKWTEEEATVFFEDCIILAEQKDETNDAYLYDFIGELARDTGHAKEIFSYLAKKFEHLEERRNRLLGIIEANCFNNTKKGKIKEASGIINLKSNYKWSDRIASDLTSNGKEIGTADAVIAAIAAKKANESK